MFAHKFDCIGRTHWGQKEDKFLFQYAFQAEPQAGDVIELKEDELIEPHILHYKWTVLYRAFIRGNMMVVIRPLESTDGLVQA